MAKNLLWFVILLLSLSANSNCIAQGTTEYEHLGITFHPSLGFEKTTEYLNENGDSTYVFESKKYNGSRYFDRRVMITKSGIRDTQIKTYLEKLKKDYDRSGVKSHLSEKEGDLTLVFYKDISLAGNRNYSTGLIQVKNGNVYFLFLSSNQRENLMGKLMDLDMLISIYDI